MTSSRTKSNSLADTPIRCSLLAARYSLSRLPREPTSDNVSLTIACSNARPVVDSRGALVRVAEIIPFRRKNRESEEEDSAVDLLTAVDAAIRDLRDIAERWGEESSRVLADECRRMLERAFDAAV
jgi:hypothetical protein